MKHQVLKYSTVIDSEQRITYPSLMVKISKIHSMTGFSRSAGNGEKFSWYWEAKSVNGKGLDVRCRLPQGIDGLDLQIREKVGKVFSRGNVNLHLSIKENGARPTYRINRDFLNELVKLAKEIHEESNNSSVFSLDSLLSVKGVIEPAEDEIDDVEIQERNNMILADLEIALTELSSARQIEGARIYDVLKVQLTEIEALSERAESIAQSQPKLIRERLKHQIDELLGMSPALPEERIGQEVALLITKADIREELDRLRAHLLALQQLLNDGGVIGRKLDFLCQELNREVNTLCSKAHNLELANLGLELKAVIEQFREQVQNIE